MSDFIFNATETDSYNKRNSNSKKIIFFISLSLFLVLSISNWEVGLAMGIFIFLVQLFKSNRRDKYFITHFELNNEQVIIKYKEKNEEKELTGDKREFKIKMKEALDVTAIRYLVIYKNNVLQINQFEIGEWNKEIFKKIILAFNN